MGKRLENVLEKIEVEESLEDRIDREERAKLVSENRTLRDWMAHQISDIAAAGSAYAMYGFMTVGLQNSLNPVDIIGDMPTSTGIILALSTRGAAPRYKEEVQEAIALYEKPMEGFFSRIGGKRFLKGLALGTGFYLIHATSRFLGLDPDFYNLGIEQAMALGGIGGLADIGLTYLQGRRYSKRSLELVDEHPSPTEQ